ncbi:C1 family peptidase [Natronospora cellulosivora (SeqCode)]
MIKKKYLFTLIIVLGFAVLIAGCDTIQESIGGETEKGSLVLELNMPPEFTEPQVASVVDLINPDIITITLRKGSKVIIEEFAPNTDLVPFSNLTIGVWEIEVVVTETINNRRYDLFYARDSVKIEADRTSYVPLNLSMVRADIHFYFYNLASELSRASIRITENVNSNNTSYTEVQNISSDFELIEFKNIQANAWDFELEFNFRNGEYKKIIEEKVYVLPGRTLFITINKDSSLGDLKISIDYELPAKAPYNLRASLINDNVYLEWDDYNEDIAGFSVYRSYSETGYKDEVALIRDSFFIDMDVHPGNTYWYWVRSHKANGMSSGFSQPVDITVAQDIVEEKGALKLINSWGPSWGPNQDGSLYLTYDAAIQNETVFFLFKSRVGYEPRALAVFEIEGENRGAWDIAIELDNRKKYFYDGIYKRFVDEHNLNEPAYIQKGGNHPFPDNKIVLDITDLLPFNNETISLKVSNGSSRLGTVKNFSIEIYHDIYNPTIYQSSTPPSYVHSGGTIILSVDGVNASLPDSFRAQSRMNLSNFAKRASIEDFDSLLEQTDNSGSETVDGFGTGLKPITENQLELAVNSGMLRQIDSAKVLSAYTSTNTSIDHSESVHFPPVGNQGSKNSCVAWSMAYYIQTFYKAQEHGWDLSNFDSTMILSPQFAYHLVNDGVDGGASYLDVLQIIENVGVSTWREMPYDVHDHTSWPSEEAFREAPFYRSATSNDDSYFYIKVARSMDDIRSIKNLLDMGYLLSISIDAHQYENLTSSGVWTSQNYRNPAPNHANTVVGYDDNFTAFGM